jgi:hypothetical protein
MSSRLILILSVLLILLPITITSTITPSVFAAGAAGVVALDVAPPSGQTSIKVTLSGKNAPNTPLSVSFAPEIDPNNSFQLMAAVQPKDDGSWDAQVYVPRDWPQYQVVPGKYLFTVQNSDRSYIAQGSFTVLPVVSPTPKGTPSATSSGGVRGALSQIIAQNPLYASIGLVLILGIMAVVVNRFGKPTA